MAEIKVVDDKPNTYTGRTVIFSDPIYQEILENGQTDKMFELIFSNNESKKSNSFEIEKIINKLENFFIKSNLGKFSYYKRSGRIIFKFDSDQFTKEFCTDFFKKILFIMGREDYFLITSNGEVTCIFR